MTKLETAVLTIFVVLFICLTIQTYNALSMVESTLVKILR